MTRGAAFLTAVGGGTGLAVLLRGLKGQVPAERLRAVVTVTDDGGSSGRLRRDFGVPPPGDIRNCIAALADDEDLLTRLFQYRFENGGDLSGHSFGNLFLTALAGITGDFYQAVLTAESVLSVRGKILPATLTDVRLSARGASGRSYQGESAIGQAGERLAALALEPAAPPAFPAAAQALAEADLVVLGPGSLYTSILPNLLIPGIREALAAARAKVVLVLNLMTQPGETDGMSGLDHLAAIEEHAGAGLVDCVLASSAPLPPDRLSVYAASGARPVAVEPQAIEARGVRVVEADLLAAGELIRHDPAKLAAAVLSLA
jgi:uncharacterized cofD-like protein